MKIATIIARVLLGLVFVVFGSNIFLALHSDAATTAGPAWRLHEGAFPSHYLHVVAIFQIVGGLLLLIGRFVPLGLVLLAPVIVNIDLVHVLMEPSRPANGRCHFAFVSSFSSGDTATRSRLSSVPDQVMATQSEKQTAHVVVRGSAKNFQQEVTAGKHHFVADEPVNVGGGDTGPDPYDYLLTSLGVCTSMTIGFYARRNQMASREHHGLALALTHPRSGL